MQCHQLAAGLILCFLVVCHPKVSQAQFSNFYYPQQNGFARQQPRSGSFSRVNNNAYQREIDLGPVDLTRGVSNTRAVTSNNGGFRNGGTTSIADRNAVSRGINLGGLDIGSTLSRTRTRTNGEVSRALEHDLNIGNLGIGTSLSRENLGRGFGLQRDGDGRLSLGLGLLNIGLSRNAQQDKAALSQAQVNAQGENAQTRANSQTQTQQQNYGNVGVKETRTNSNAVGRSQFGQTQTNFFGGRNFFGGGNIARSRRSSARSTRTQYRPTTLRLRRPKRHTDFIPFKYSQESSDAELKRQRSKLFPNFQKRKSNYRGKWPKVPSQQQTGYNTHSNNGTSSTGLNFHNDRSSGQVSSANVAQMKSQAVNSSLNNIDAQSESLKFDPKQQQATSSNAGTTHPINDNSERLCRFVTNNNPFGNSTNTGNTSADVSPNGDRQGSESNANSQSKSSSVTDLNAFVGTSAPSNASTNSQNVGNSSVSAGSHAGYGGNKANTKAFAYNGGLSGFHRREQKVSYSIDTRYPRPIFLSDSQPDEQKPLEATELLDLNPHIYSNTSLRQTVDIDLQDDPTPQTRTIGTILDFFSNMFSDCVSPCTMDAYNSNRCCNIPTPPPAACCQGQQYLPPHTPLLPPRPYYPRQPNLMNCCSVCTRFSYYGPPPCIRYNTGGYYGGIASGTGGGAGLNFGAGSPFGNAGVSLRVPLYYG